MMAEEVTQMVPNASCARAGCKPRPRRRVADPSASGLTETEGRKTLTVSRFSCYYLNLFPRVPA